MTVSAQSYLFTLHNFYPERLYGAEKVCIAQMRELLKRGYKVGLFYAGKRRLSPTYLKEKNLEGLRLFRVSYKLPKAQVLLSTWNPKTSHLFKQALKKFQPDAVIFHHLVRLSLTMPLVVPKHSNIAKILYLHDFYLACPSYSLLRANGALCKKQNILTCSKCLFEARFGVSIGVAPQTLFLGSALLLFRKEILRRVLANIDLFISPSKFLVSELRKRGIKIENFVHNPNGVDNNINGKARKINKPLTFGFLGNVLKKKGIEVVAKAFQDISGGQLLIKGFSDKTQMERFRQRYPKLNASLELFSSDTRGFFEKVDVIVVPSIWYENQPSVILEAFRYGKPVICSDIGGMQEIVADHKYGLHFRTGSWKDLRRKVEWMINNPDEVKRMQALIPPWPTHAENADILIQSISSQGFPPTHSVP